MHFTYIPVTIFDGISYCEAEFNPIFLSLLPYISSAQYFDTSKTDGTLYIIIQTIFPQPLCFIQNVSYRYKDE